VEYSAAVVKDRYLADPFIGVEGGDGPSDAGDGAADRTTSNDVVRDILYMPKKFHSNCRDVEYSPSVRDRYLPDPFTGVVVVLALQMSVMELGIEPHQTTW
jgi:hypothetical protein